MPVTRALTRSQTRAKQQENNLQPPTPAIPSSPPKPSPKPQRHPASGSQRLRGDHEDGSEKSDDRSRKRVRLSSPIPESRDSPEIEEINPVASWVLNGHWPSQETQDPGMEVTFDIRNLGESPLSGLGSPSSSQRRREGKSAQYRDPRFRALLEMMGSYMYESELEITDESKAICRELLETAQETPKDSLFSDDIFEATCRNMRHGSKIRIIRDISLLIVPSAEVLTAYGVMELQCLIEGNNEEWSNPRAISDTQPQPTYSVGFKNFVFSNDQFDKLLPFISNESSPFLGTGEMFFPFLTCEVKDSDAPLDIADCQNAHSMTLAVRGLVELFRLVGLEEEINRQILGFSISHNHEDVQIYGHYAVIEGESTKQYRYPVRRFNFTELDGENKWIAYCFTRNLYDIWMPAHLARICSAIDLLPLPGVQETVISEKESISSCNITEIIQRHSARFTAPATRKRKN